MCSCDIWLVLSITDKGPGRPGSDVGQGKGVDGPEGETNMIGSKLKVVIEWVARL
jgi:hypothetical protein